MEGIKRDVYKYVNKEWIKIEFKDIKKGDIFMLFEPFEIPEAVTTRSGRAVFVAKSNAINGFVDI